MKKEFYSSGKLLLTGEYVVLDGATAIALPTKYGQSLEIEEIADPVISWQSYDPEEGRWLECRFEMEELRIHTGHSSFKQQEDPRSKLLFILRTALSLAPHFPEISGGYKITSKLDFPRHWGLGSSSTLLVNLSEWLNIDPYELLEKTFGGSGYDVAVALENQPILYRLENSRRAVSQISYHPSFVSELFFIYLNRKQSSLEAIAAYRNLPKKSTQEAAEKINELSFAVLQTRSLNDFERLMLSHESTLSELLKQPTVKQRLFSDYPKMIKSLGGWGGDFVLVSATDQDLAYFRKKGFHTIIPFDKIIK